MVMSQKTPNYAYITVRTNDGKEKAKFCCNR